MTGAKPLQVHEALHGYMMPSREELYNEAAAEKVWGRMEALFARNLG